MLPKKEVQSGRKSLYFLFDCHRKEKNAPESFSFDQSYLLKNLSLSDNNWKK